MERYFYCEFDNKKTYKLKYIVKLKIKRSKSLKQAQRYQYTT